MALLSHMERSLLGCWKHQERASSLSGQGIGSKAAGLSTPEGPTTPGSRLRGQSSLLAQDVPHTPAQHFKLAAESRAMSQVSKMLGPPPQQGECSDTSTSNTMNRHSKGRTPLPHSSPALGAHSSRSSIAHIHPRNQPGLSSTCSPAGAQNTPRSNPGALTELLGSCPKTAKA